MCTFFCAFRAATAYPERGQISVRNPKANDSEPPKDFFFDAVFDDKVEQKHIYSVCASGVVESVLNGYNGTIFAYGQTGAGKVRGKMQESQSVLRHRCYYLKSVQTLMLGLYHLTYIFL